MQSDIAQEHKAVKKNSYWENLVGGGTAFYKAKKIDELLKTHGPSKVNSMIDIGCGTCELMFHYRDEFAAQSLTLMDYDEKVIQQLREKYPQEPIHWLVADVFEMGKRELSYDLAFLLDMVHEVYSFFGRPDRDILQTVEHERGLEAVDKLLANVAQSVNPGGAIVITDNVLCESKDTVRVQLNSEKVVSAVQFLLKNYPTRKLDGHLDGQTLTINARDFCILLTQYNKIKNEDWDRWNVEKMEIHQYLSLEEYRQRFDRLGFDLHTIVETPEDALTEWTTDFTMLSGLAKLPEKRITLLARKRQGPL